MAGGELPRYKYIKKMVDKQKIFHKKIRINGFLYKQTNNVCFITICLKDKNQLFHNNTNFTKACMELFKSYSINNNLSIFAYCFMPDHIHILLSPSDKKSIIDFVREFKSLTTKIAWEYGIKEKIWQKSFYDHFLRSEEDIYDTAMYILNNPLRKNLVTHWKNYEFSGSLVYEL